MKRLLLLTSIILLQLAAGQQASCLSPDKVTGSPIPPLQPAAERKTKWSAERGEVGLGSSLSLSTKPPVKKSSRKATSSKQQAPPKQPADAGVADESYPDGYQDLWNSPEMLEARASIVEFCRRAAQTSPKEGEQFIEQLSKLPPEQMLEWLNRYQARKQSAVRNQERDAFTRRLGVERSLGRIEANRRAAENVAELRRQANAARQTTVQQMPWRRSYSFGVDDLTRGFGFSYDPMEAVVDPMSPRGYGRKVAAAMSLPGDLPPSDPRNFIQGEAGVDLGEWANNPNAQPPALAVPASTPAPPVPVAAPE